MPKGVWPGAQDGGGPEWTEEELDEFFKEISETMPDMPTLLAKHIWNKSVRDLDPAEADLDDDPDDDPDDPFFGGS